MKANLISKFNILSETSNLFETQDKYVIPLYQRAYAWKEKELVQLVEDVNGSKEHYYIGSLIVYNDEQHTNVYEVIDGQQRLTSLFLLLACLNIDVSSDSLSFACRDKSNYTLGKLKKLKEDDWDGVDTDRVEENILAGLKILKNELTKIDVEIFKEKLHKVVLFRIQVPKHTDLNRYFEIMNTRGEQLEQHDILKATLMSFLNEKDHAVFAKIWDACSDMSGYVQMNFDTTARGLIFDGSWEGYPSDKWDAYKDIVAKRKSRKKEELTIADVIKQRERIVTDEIVDKDDVQRRFESIITFPFFLLHCLKVYVSFYKPGDKRSKNLVDELLDDKKLTEQFDRVLDILDEEEKEQFAKRFVVLMLQVRFLFDSYIIKREYSSDNNDGAWSLKELHVSGLKNKKKPYFSNTKIIYPREWDQGRKSAKRNKNVLMLQSALRVSYTSPKVMHWITVLLDWLYCMDENVFKENLYKYGSRTESILKNAIRNDFLEKCPNGSYMLGVNTPHVVFNYLDYLLWKEDEEQGNKKYSDFIFEFRNSVEHWYPQHPSEGTFEKWEGNGYDTFGNLCIIPRNVNSKFSNMSPEAKKSTFKNMIDKGSLKLRIMRDETKQVDSRSASYCWRDEVCKQHEYRMIALLKKAIDENEE